MAEEKPKKVAIIASQGTLDKAYPPLIIGSTAAALDMEVAIFFTFYGLDIIHKKRLKKLKVPPLANPAMPQPVPGISVPNILGVLPGMTSVATGMMKSWMKKANVPTVPELVELCQDADVRFIACQMTVDVLGINEEDIIDGVELAGAAAFLEFAQDADITLYM